MHHQRVFELVARADLCASTSTLVDPGFVEQESPIGNSIDGRVMRGKKQLDLLVEVILALRRDSTVTSDSTC